MGIKHSQRELLVKISNGFSTRICIQDLKEMALEYLEDKYHNKDILNLITSLIFDGIQKQLGSHCEEMFDRFSFSVIDKDKIQVFIHFNEKDLLSFFIKLTK